MQVLEASPFSVERHGFAFCLLQEAFFLARGSRQPSGRVPEGSGGFEGLSGVFDILGHHALQPHHLF